eukprot:gene3286-5727_t
MKKQLICYLVLFQLVNIINCLQLLNSSQNGRFYHIYAPTTNVFSHKYSIHDRSIYYAPIETPRSTNYFDNCLDLRSIIFKYIYWAKEKHDTHNFCENYFCKNDTTPYFLSPDGVNNPEFNGKNYHLTVHDYCLKCDHMKNENESKYKTCKWFDVDYCNDDCGINSTCIFHQQPLCYLSHLNLYLCFERKLRRIFKETLILEVICMCLSGILGIVILSIDAYEREQLFVSSFILNYFSIYMTKVLILFFIAEVTEEYKDAKVLKFKINKPLAASAISILFILFGTIYLAFSYVGNENYYVRVFAGVTLIFVIVLIGGLEIGFCSFSFEFFTLLKKSWIIKISYLINFCINEIISVLMIVSFLMIVIQNIAGLDSFGFGIYLSQYLLFSIIFFVKFCCILVNLSMKIFKTWILKKYVSSDVQISESPQILEIDITIQQLLKKKEFEGIELKRTEIYSDTIFFFEHDPSNYHQIDLIE